MDVLLLLQVLHITVCSKIFPCFAFVALLVTSEQLSRCGAIYVGFSKRLSHDLSVYVTQYMCVLKMQPVSGAIACSLVRSNRFSVSSSDIIIRKN